MRGQASAMGSGCSASQKRGACLFPLTLSDQPCGVENLTRKLVAALTAGDAPATCELLPISGRWRDLPSVLRKVTAADAVVFNLPLVAWKHMIAIPLMVLVF